jgi:hypothetical protein
MTMLGSSTVTRQKTISSVLTFDLPDYSRDDALVTAGSGSARTIAMGMVVGAVTRGAVTVTRTNPTGSNKGAITLANPAFAAGVMEGRWRITMVSEAVTSPAQPATWALERPDGSVEATFQSGEAYDGSVKFTKAVGSADAAKDVGFIDVVVAAGVGTIAALDPAATDGRASVFGIALTDGSAPVNVTGTTPVSVLRRLATVKAAGLIWPAGITAEAKEAALAELEAQGIIVR